VGVPRTAPITSERGASRAGETGNRMRNAVVASCAIALGLGLVGCNRSAADLPTSPDQATPLPPTLTSVFPLPTLPTALPSATLPPPNTATVTPTLTITSTPSPGPSPSPTGPGLSPDDPRYTLDPSTPDYADDFSSHSNWGEFSYPESATNVYTDGGLKAKDNVVDHTIWWSVANQAAGDVYAEVTARVGECSGEDGYGLAVRVGGENFDRGYALEFSCDGSYRLRKFIGNVNPAVLVDWCPSSQIHSGADATNRMGLLAKGDILYAVANGEIISEVSDNEYTYGFFGLYASAEETPGLEVVFDDFALWHLQP
jgi:hypothetical protein